MEETGPAVACSERADEEAMADDFIEHQMDGFERGVEETQEGGFEVVEEGGDREPEDPWAEEAAPAPPLQPSVAHVFVDISGHCRANDMFKCTRCLRTAGATHMAARQSEACCQPCIVPGPFTRPSNYEVAAAAASPASVIDGIHGSHLLYHLRGAVVCCPPIV